MITVVWCLLLLAAASAVCVGLVCVGARAMRIHDEGEGQ